MAKRRELIRRVHSVPGTVHFLLKTLGGRYGISFYSEKTGAGRGAPSGSLLTSSSGGKCTDPTLIHAYTHVSKRLDLKLALQRVHVFEQTPFGIVYQYMPIFPLHFSTAMDTETMTHPPRLGSTGTGTLPGSCRLPLCP